MRTSLAFGLSSHRSEEMGVDGLVVRGAAIPFGKLRHNGTRQNIVPFTLAHHAKSQDELHRQSPLLLWMRQHFVKAPTNTPFTGAWSRYGCRKGN